jgi:hypothetical protein
MARYEPPSVDEEKAVHAPGSSTEEVTQGSTEEQVLPVRLNAREVRTPAEKIQEVKPDQRLEKLLLALTSIRNYTARYQSLEAFIAQKHGSDSSIEERTGGEEEPLAAKRQEFEESAEFAQFERLKCVWSVIKELMKFWTYFSARI